MIYQPPTISLDGITLEMIVSKLVEVYGWEELGKAFKMKCFITDPSIMSCLKFLRKTPWARKKVETYYLKFRKAQLKKANKSGSPEDAHEEKEEFPKAQLSRLDSESTEKPEKEERPNPWLNLKVRSKTTARDKFLKRKSTL